jgi:hypothetical protein
MAVPCSESHVPTVWQGRNLIGGINFIYLANKKLLLILKLSHSLLELCNICTDTFDVLFSCSLEHILHLPDVHRIGALVCTSRTLLGALAGRNLPRFCW